MCKIAKVLGGIAPGTKEVCKKWVKEDQNPAVAADQRSQLLTKLLTEIPEKTADCN